MLEELQQATQRADNKTKIMAYLGPDEPIKTKIRNMEFLEKYLYFSRDILIGKDNQTCELSSSIALASAAYRKLGIYSRPIYL